MGVYAGPDVSESGLVLALDAGNSKGFDSTENLVLQSSNIGISPTYFSNASGIVVLNTTATTDPNNLFEASSLDNNGNTGTNYVFGGGGITLAANTTYTYSIHIKQGTKPDFQITIDENSFGGKRYYSIFTYSTETITTGVTGNNDGVVIGSTVTKLINGWYRLSLTFRTSTTSVSGLVDMINRFGDTSGINYVWGRQLEYGLSASPYYPTTSSIKNRGTTLLDLSGRGNTGTLTNGPTYNSSNGGSIVFDGINDYINISDNNSLTSTSALTINCWVRATAFNGGYSSIIGKGTSDADEEYCLLIHSSFLYFDVGAGAGPYTQPSYTFNTNTWYNICCVHSRTSGSSSLLCYVNSNFINNNTIQPTLSPGDNSLPVSIGSRFYNSINGPFNGNIAQISIHNRALTTSEIQQNFNSMRGRFGI